MGMEVRGKMRFAAAVLVALLAGSASAVAQPTDAAGTAELKELAFEVRREGVRRAVTSIVTRLEKLGHQTQADRVKAKTITRAFVESHMETKDLEKIIRELFKPELRARTLTADHLKVDFDLFRSWKSNSFTIKDVSGKMPADVTGFEPPRRRGYPTEVAAIDNRANHSMHDLHDYIADRFTDAALERAISKGYVVELHVGGEVEALSDIKNRGWNVLGEVKSPKGSYERLLVTQSPQGEIRYVVTGTVDGLDRVRHLTSLLRFSGENGRGIANNKIEIVGDANAIKESNYRAMRDGLDRMGLKSETAIIGFRMSLRNELQERTLARRGAEHLRDVLGSDPASGLLEKLKAERGRATGAARTQLDALIAEVEGNTKLAKGMGSSPARVFGKIADLKALIEAQKTLVGLQKRYPQSKTIDALVADGKLRLPGGVSHTGYTIARPIEFGPLAADELRVKTANGRTKSIRLVNNYYGDTMSEVVRALLDTGHSKLAYFGTAGGVGEGVKIGDIHIPKNVHDWKHTNATNGVDNKFLEFFEGKTTPLGERLKSGTRLGNVFSPAEETMPWLEDVKNRGYKAIEVENSYIMREVAKHNRSAPNNGKASLHTSVIISDIPGSHQTLGSNNGATTSTFEKMVDHYLEALEIKDLELVSKEEIKPATRPLARTEHARKALEVAEKLVPRNLPKSSFLRDRLTSIVEKLSLAELNSIDTGKAKLKPGDIPGLTFEDRHRLEAEVSGAYTDQKLLESLGKANSVMSSLTSELRRRHPNSRYSLKLGGGIQTGEFSPVEGLQLEVKGNANVKADVAAILEEVRARVPGAPPIHLGPTAANAIEIGKGEVFRSEARPLIRELHSRALIHHGANHMGTRVVYAGREHDATARDSELFNRFETYGVGPTASAEDVKRYRERLARNNAALELVPVNDPRLRGAQGRTIVDATGKTIVFLPSDKPISKFALIDELTHVKQIESMRSALGAEKVAELFRHAAAGDPIALAKLVEWEIKAKRNIKMVLGQDDPNRQLLEREIERLKRVLDPYLDARANTKSGLNWEKVRSMSKAHAQGGASFVLGLFLKDLARVVETGDRQVIEAFFNGLATTEFWSHYGLFVVGAEAGTIAYTKWLERFVRPGFVNTVLKSNIALATGMALPEIIRGKFDGKTFAINFTGLFLSSTAVKAGLAALKWVMPLGKLSRYQGLARALKVARGVPGWIYAGVELAVVLYFGEKISARINTWAEGLEMKREIEKTSAALIEAAGKATDPDDPEFWKLLEDAGVAHLAWRDRILRPAVEATENFSARVNGAGRTAGNTGVGLTRVGERSAALRAAAERVRARNDAKVKTQIDAALAKFESERKEAIERAYHHNKRSGAYDPLGDARGVSDNRLQAYDDEALLYEAAAKAATDPKVAEFLRGWATLTREIKTRERELLDPAAVRGGASSALERATD